jgi:PAS domain S-box-containing protein
MSLMLFFISILATGILAFLVAAYAWRHRDVPGSRTFVGLALSECFLAVAEILSMLSPTLVLALFWFKIRYLFIAFVPVFWLIFALEYGGAKNWLTKRFMAGLFILPFITQILVWTNSRYGLWTSHEVGFHRNGPFWIAEIGARVPGPGFLAHSFYALILLSIGILFLLLTAWRLRRLYRWQALIVTGAAFLTFAIAVTFNFNLLPHTEFNPFTPCGGVSMLLTALAIFRFQFLRRAPAEEPEWKRRQQETERLRSMAMFLFIFLIMATGITTFSYISYQHYEKQFRAQVEAQLSSISALKARDIEVWRRQRLADVEILYGHLAFTSLVQRFLQHPSDAKVYTELQVWLDRLQTDVNYNRIFLLDAHGVERISSPASSEALGAQLIRETTAVLSSGQVILMDFYRETENGPIHLALLIPIQSAQPAGRPLGVLVMSIDPNVYLYPFIKQWPVPSASAETLLIRRDGDNVQYLNDLRFRPDAALNLRIPLDNIQVPAVKAVLGQEGIVEGVDYRGVPVLAAVRAVPHSPWFLEARIDLAEIYAPLHERLWLLLIFTGALVAASGAGLGMVWRDQRARYYRSQVLAAQALNQSEEKFRKAFFISPDSVAITRRADGVLVSVNPGFTQILGYTEAEVLGKTTLEIGIWVNPDDRKKIVTELSEHGTVFNYEVPFRTKDGSIRICLLSAAVIDLDGIPHSLHTTRDITDRKRAEEEIRTLNTELEQRVRHRTAELEASNQELEAFAYSVSHDLRSPLRAMDGFTSILVSDYPDQLDEDGKHYLMRIQEAARRMGQLIDDLLNLSRVTRKEINRQQVNLSNLAQEIAAELQTREPQRKVEFIIEPQLIVHGDSHLFQILLDNLMNNAWKFTGRRTLTRIELGVTDIAGERILFVRDNGVGFDMKYSDKLFSPFQRLHGIDEFPGTGIGLATVKRIITRHGGRIWSTATVENGATFYFTLGGLND